MSEAPPSGRGAVLTLNAGSSSLKFALFDTDGAVLLRGQFEAIDTRPQASAHAADGAALDPPAADGQGHEAVLPALLDWVAHHLGRATLRAVGHRIVHGGDRFAGPARIDDQVLAAIEALAPLAPLHQPHNVAAIRAAAAARPGIPQVACFDTAFHRTLPAVARRHALPDRLGLHRYGFHGLSYEWIAGQLPHHLVHGRVIVAHLGSGASLCALQAGQSVETTMGTTPLDGLVMGTRCGTLDPGAVLYLLQHHGMSAPEVEQLLYRQSGLLGVSGVASDMRTLHDSAEPAAAAAIELFAYRIAQLAGGLMAAFEPPGAASAPLDAFVFTGGIGEHDPRIRALVADRLAWLGLAIDPAAPAPGRIDPRRAGSAPEVWVIPTDEEAVIARQATRLIGNTRP